MAAMYGLSEDEAAEGVPWADLSTRFHPEDLRADPGARRQVREEGGLFVWEHRILPAPGIVRWVLARGHFQQGANGRMRGHGIVIDITDSRTDGQIDGPAHFLTAYESPGTILERIADRAIEACELIRTLDVADSSRLRLLVDALLHELGRQIAASLQSDPPAPKRPRGTKLN
ncbi:PAS domain-containing protein [Methylobacterium sp. J-030]|uniref:PAS domain-containing protein n=1 Tax=Methylobacterium sp. J-030 TaxID=2836627 RepID=UPI001FBAF1F7|nr:PAS domain-containing protein [Methylobacterium sp. J-030]MCJ2067673.1 PAS domain-containing protein [Methylobacterium sp. J-030]